MQNRNNSVLYLLVVLFFAISSPLISNTVTISGIVKNQDDEPIKKVLVSLRTLKDEIFLEESTNRKGVFTFEDIRPKFYYITFESEVYGTKRIKLNPRKNRNKDLDIKITLNGDEKFVECYLYDSKPPSKYDPILNIKTFELKSSPEEIFIEWKDIKQAQLYELYENGVEIFSGDDTRFSKKVKSGVEYCFAIKALGNFGTEGQLSKSKCTSARSQSPRDIKIETYKNAFSLSWPSVDGAYKYNIYRDDEFIEQVDMNEYQVNNLEFGKEYYFKISAIDGLGKESDLSIEVKKRTHPLIEPPILSSMKSKNNITIIWNNVEGAKSYNIYREGENINNTSQNSFVDSSQPGKKFCYKVTSVDVYDIESEKSNIHCTKVPIGVPKGLQANADVSSVVLTWDQVTGASYYNIYEKIDQDSMVFLGKTVSNQYNVKSLEYSADVCYVLTASDEDGEESAYSISACNKVFDPPNFIIQNHRLLEPSGNNILDAKENGSIQFSVFNDGQSPAHNVMVSVIQRDHNLNIKLGKPIIMDTLDAGRIKFVKIDISADLKIASGINEFELNISSREKVKLHSPYLFKIESKSMLPTKMIVADFAVTNDFNTRYIPKNEVAKITLRIQNVGEGSTDYIDLKIKKNRSFTMPEFNGIVTLPAFGMGDYMDIEIPVITSSDNFMIDIELIDYLGKVSNQRVNLQTMRNYRSPMELTIADIGTQKVVFYPDELGDVDVDRHIPFSRKNPNGIAIIFGTQNYNDVRYPAIEYANRDRDVVRKYFSQAFGFSDFQMLPSKPWQMEGGPSQEEYRLVFDPYDGDLKKRINSAVKYSNIEKLDIFLYYRGYGEWVNGRPLLIPKDAIYDRHSTKYPLEEMLKNLSTLSILSSVNNITLFMDITFVNPEKSAGLVWDYPDLSDKISVLSACSNGESSQIYDDKKHSYFTYSLLKAFAGGADDGNNVVILGEIVEYVYRSIPQYLSQMSGDIYQNPKFNGKDLKRTVIDFR